MKLSIFLGATEPPRRVLAERAPDRDLAAPAFGGGALDGKPPARPTAIRGDAFDPRAATSAIDAVLCASGAGRRGGVRAEGGASIVAGMEATGARRLIGQALLDASESVGDPKLLGKRITCGLPSRSASGRRRAREERIRRARLGWTTVRPAAFMDRRLTDVFRRGSSGASPRGSSLKISGADVADFALSQLQKRARLRRTLCLSY